MAEPNRPQIARDPELERVRSWWDEHGKAIVAGVVLGIAGVVGFNYWQHYQQTRAEEASVLFERLRNMLEEAEAATEAATEADADTETTDQADADTDTTTDADADTETETTTQADADTEADADPETSAAIRRLAGDLMADYRATPYAVHGAFALAKFAVDHGDIEGAAEALRWALDNGDDDSLRHIARLRLAMVLLAGGQADEVITLVTVVETAGFTARYQELEGDAHLQKGDADAARSAYRRSLAALPQAALPQAAQERALVKLKLDQLGG